MSETEKTTIVEKSTEDVPTPVTTDASQAKDTSGVEITQITTESTKEN